MEATKPTKIKDMLSGNEIFVPDYQRAYSWDKNKQVKTFLSDLDEYSKSESSTKSKYYFGHFLFQKKSGNQFEVIDGQQRLATIVMFLSALFRCLKDRLGKLSKSQRKTFGNIIKSREIYRFTTVDYDNQLFKDHVIDEISKKVSDCETESAKRIVRAFNFFETELKEENAEYLEKMLRIVQFSRCTTHLVEDEAEAIQMFLFQNDRGKTPSNLEIIKARFMFHVHLHGGEKREDLLQEIKGRFEEIYKSSSSIEANIKEDDVLTYTLKVHFDSLDELKISSIERVDEELNIEQKKKTISFIKSFTQSLELSFQHLKTFFKKDGEESKIHSKIYSLISLGRIGIAIPFIIKAYKFGIPKDEVSELCFSFESLILRHRLIRTKAKIIKRLNDIFEKFTEKSPDIKPIVERIIWLATIDSNFTKNAYWNDEALENALQRDIESKVAKFLLWKYENHLKSKEKEWGYNHEPVKFGEIKKLNLEHISPITKKKEKPKDGYDIYNEKFKNECLECIGNYLLISKSQNSSIGNKPFKDKRKTYTFLYQQREIREDTEKDQVWKREQIEKRKKKIIDVIIKKYAPTKNTE